MRISVDRDVCVGAGQCVLAAPEIFDQDDDGLVVVRSKKTVDEEAVSDAAHLCPSAAIRLLLPGRP